MPSLATFENRVREHGETDRTKIRKVAKLAKRRFDAFTHEPTEQEFLEWFKTITYSDPTGDEASENADAAARRVAARVA
jgi:hypothetical protein